MIQAHQRRSTHERHSRRHHLYNNLGDCLRFLVGSSVDLIPIKLEIQKWQKLIKMGWIRHRGGKCPLSGNPVVDVRLRTGAWQRGYASCYEWSHNNQPYDIMAYSIHTATQQEPQPMTAEQIRTKYMENFPYHPIAMLHTKKRRAC